MVRISASRTVSIAVLAGLAAAPLLGAGAADETSSGDKLRILYSNRFTFTDRGLPLVTVEIMSGESRVDLGADDGVLVMPDGEGGSTIEAGSNWTVHVEKGRAAKIREWTIVARYPAAESDAAEAAGKRWRVRKLPVEIFEIGTLFAVDGSVMDTRELLVAVAPVPAPRGAKKAREIGERYHVQTEVYKELLSRPEGTIVARSGDTEVRNPAVLWFAPRKPKQTIEVKGVRAGHGGSQLKSHREDRRYFGAVYVTVGGDGRLTVANAVAADDLLAGLVPSEMFPSAPAAALRAQSIAARTELLQKIGTRHLADPFLVCSSQHCQVYSGAGREHPRTTRAVADTRGQVLLREGGGLVDARYSAACGGHTEHNEVIWGGESDGALRGRVDGTGGKRFRTVDDDNVQAFLDSNGPAWCKQTRFSKGRYRWRARIEAAELTQRVSRDHSGVGRVIEIVPRHRGVSGRITSIEIVGNRGRARIDGELTIRRLLGGLRSSLFVANAIGARGNPQAFEFTGAGFGHGVGLCQLGAIGQAEAGRDHEAILEHYYRGASVRRLY